MYRQHAGQCVRSVFRMTPLSNIDDPPKWQAAQTCAEPCINQRTVREPSAVLLVIWQSKMTSEIVFEMCYPRIKVFSIYCRVRSTVVIY